MKVKNKRVKYSRDSIWATYGNYIHSYICIVDCGPLKSAINTFENMYSQFHSVSKRHHFTCIVLQYTSADQISERAPSGCYISGLYLEGAMWNKEAQCLQRSLPKVLIEELPILRIIPIEAHRLKLQVRNLLSTTMVWSQSLAYEDNGTKWIVYN